MKRLTRCSPCPVARRDRTRAGRGPIGQRGAVLVVGLIVLLVMMMLGISGMRTSVLQELMAGHAKDANSAFQAGEGGLQAALDYLVSRGEAQVPPPIKRSGAAIAWPTTAPVVWPACEVQDADPTGAPATTGTFNPCGTLNAVLAAWATGSGTTIGQVISSAGGARLRNADVTDDNQPRYVIESRFVPSDDTFEAKGAHKGYHYFKVSAVGFDPATNSRAILQTNITQLYQ